MARWQGGLSADFDGNGSVGAGGYALWAANFGNACGVMASASSPPAAPLASVATVIVASPGPATTSASFSPTSPGPAEPRREPLSQRPVRNPRAALERVFADLARSRHGRI